jgi:hypothetical protein
MSLNIRGLYAVIAILKRCGVLRIGVAKEIVYEINLNTILLK